MGFQNTTSLLILALALSGCAAPQSSFETLGVPDVAPDGDAAVIFGWAREERAGWDVLSLRVDRQSPNRWQLDEQRPRIIRLPAGTHELQVRAVQRSGQQWVRRIRLRPVPVRLAEGQVQLCTLHVTTRGRPRPRLACSHLRGPEAPPPVRQAPGETAAPSSPVQPTPAENEGLRRLLETINQRLDRIEERLDTMRGNCPPCNEECPNSRGRFARDFDEESLEEEQSVVSDEEPRFDTDFVE